MPRRVLTLFCATVLLSAACSSDEGGPDDQAAPTPSSSANDGGRSHSTGQPTENFAYTLGRPPTSPPTRDIRIAMTKGFAYTPDRVEVAAGETVRFEVTNRDTVPHEFVLGVKEYQQVHDSQASSGGVPHDYSPYSVHVRPGETRSLDWTFDQPGEVLYACHVPGHYDRGMIGAITVS